MTKPAKVTDFLAKNKGIKFCDDCLADRLVINRHQVATITLTLATIPCFKREKDECSICGSKTKLVIWANWPVV